MVHLVSFESLFQTHKTNSTQSSSLSLRYVFVTLGDVVFVSVLWDKVKWEGTNLYNLHL